MSWPRRGFENGVQGCGSYIQATCTRRAALGKTMGCYRVSMGVGEEGDVCISSVLVYDATAILCGGGGMKVNSTVYSTGGFYLRQYVSSSTTIK